MSYNSTDSISKLRQNSQTWIITHCLTKGGNGEIDHSKCSGYYLDSYGFGFKMTCLCACHRDERSLIDP